MLVSLLVMEPDFGQTMLILMVWGALFFIAGMRMVWVAGLGGAAGAGLFAAYLFVPHVAGRIKRFMNPASGDTFQVDTAMEAFYNGGWFGQDFLFDLERRIFAQIFDQLVIESGRLAILDEFEWTEIILRRHDQAALLDLVETGGLRIPDQHRHRELRRQQAEHQAS
jgi:hypothetical protein